MKQQENDKSKKQTGKQNQEGQGSKEIQETNGSSNSSASRGGTTDMDSATTIGGRNTTQSGSGLKTKRNVTGSDYDGQTSE